ncbi:hypothetical protein PV326_012147, partial [Microctonus aethiopoides]
CIKSTIECLVDCELTGNKRQARMVFPNNLYEELAGKFSSCYNAKSRLYARS